jgi:hypothetical protein
MTCGLKVRIVEQEEKTITGQWLGKHAPVATDIHATKKKLLEAVFFVQSMLRLYNKLTWMP